MKNSILVFIVLLLSFNCYSKDNNRLVTKAVVNLLKALAPVTRFSNVTPPHTIDANGEMNNCVGGLTGTFVSAGAYPDYTGTVIRTSGLLDARGNSMNLTQNINNTNAG
jgi:hypothetical protein